MKIIQGELYNMFASFKMDDLITLGSNLEKYYAIGMEEKRISQRMVEKQLDKYLSSTGELQAVEIENDWFPTVNADVFLSHSHKDEKQIIALAGELRSEYGLRSFIDSCVWGYSEDLLRIINNNYNLKENEDGTNIYDYEGSNQASTHVNMILNSASTSFLVNAVVGSSIIINFALNISALLIATICFWATDKRLTFSSKSISILIFLIASSAIFLTFFQLIVFLPDANSEFNARFSATVKLGNKEKS